MFALTIRSAAANSAVETDRGRNGGAMPGRGAWRGGALPVHPQGRTNEILHCKSYLGAGSASSGGEAAGVAGEGGQGGRGVGEVRELGGDGDLQFCGEGGDVGGGGGEEPAEQGVEAVLRAAEGGFVGAAFEGEDGGLGAAELGEGVLPSGVKGLGCARHGFSTALEANGRGGGAGEDRRGARGA